MTPAVIINGLSPQIVGELERTHRVIQIAAARELEFVLAREIVHAVVLAADHDVDGMCGAFARCADRLRESGAACIVVAATDVERLERFMDGLRHYIFTGHPERSCIAALVGAAPRDDRPDPERLADWVAKDPELLSFSRTLDSGSNVEVILSHLEHATRSILRADRSHCLFGTAPPDSSVGDRVLKVSAGLTGYIAMTGEPALASAGAPDSRWYAPADTGGPDPVHFVGAPIPACGSRAFGVLTALRSSYAEPFSNEDLRRARTLAACAAPVLEYAHARSLVARRLTVGPHDAKRQLFRPDGPTSDDDHGDRPVTAILREPTWLQHAFSLCVLVSLVVFIVLSLKSVDETLELPFVIAAPAPGAHGNAAGDSQLVAALPSPARGTIDVSQLHVRLTLDRDKGSHFIVPLRDLTVERVSRSIAEAIGLPRMREPSPDLFVIRATVPHRVSRGNGTSVQLRAGTSGVARFTGGSHPILFDLIPGWLSPDWRAGARTKS